MSPKDAKPSKRVPAKIHFGLVLRLTREAMGLSQETLGEMSELHRTYIGQVERGERNISIDNMERLADAVGIPLWEMLRQEPPF